MRGSLAAGTLLLALLAGCGSPEAADDAHLAVYLGAPLSGQDRKEGESCAAGARAALDEGGSEAAGIEVGLTVLDATGGQARAPLSTTAENARQAVQDSTSIAYVGETDPALTRTSLPITNDAGLLQISPVRPAPDLLSPFEGSDEVPPETQPSGARTFGGLEDPGPADGEACGGAVAVVLDAVERAEDPLSRDSVVAAFLAPGEHDSVAGRYTVDDLGVIALGAAR